jgi:hypothetical protein
VQTERNESWLSIAEVQPKMGFSPKGGSRKGERKYRANRMQSQAGLSYAEVKPMFTKVNIVQGERRAKLV